MDKWFILGLISKQGAEQGFIIKEKATFKFKRAREPYRAGPVRQAQRGVVLSGSGGEGVRGAQGHRIRGDRTALARRLHEHSDWRDRTLDGEQGLQLAHRR